MKKTTTLLFLSFFFCMQLYAQWVPCNNGMNNYVWGSAVYNGELYACGNFDQADGNPALAISRWNGSSWSDVGGGFQTNPFSNVIRGLIVFNNELIAGGYVDTVAGMPIHKVARWNGTSWSAMGTDCPISTINCFAIHNGELYAGGEGSGAVKVCVAKWTGSNWLPLDTEGGNTNVWALASYNGELYAGGGFSNFNGSGAAGIARWNGSSWSSIGTGFTLFNQVNAMTVFQSKLYIGGSFTSIGGISANNIVSWDGTTWTALAGGVNAQVQSLFSNGTKLFVGGAFWMVNSSMSANRAAYWDGTSWTVLGTDLGSGAKTICIYNNELYYGGEGAFNGQNYFAKWSGGTFNGITDSGEELNLQVYPNPVREKLYVKSKRKLDFKITDVTGKTIKNNTEVTSIDADLMVIDINDLKPGFYFLLVQGQQVRAIKFMVY